MANNAQRHSLIVFIIAVTLLLPSLGFAAASWQSQVVSIKTPENLANWLKNDFEYVWESFDAWQSPQETINLKKGDCEDFAILAAEVLRRLGVSSDILIIKFKDLKTAHAVCAFKGRGGKYQFISNRQLIETQEDKLQEAIKKIYPDWDYVIFTSPQREYSRLLVSHPQRKISLREISTALK